MTKTNHFTSGVAPFFSKKPPPQMSRFFEDILEDEKKEIKKKTHIETVQKTTPKLSKKEKFYNELQTRVFDLEDDNSKKSEKNVKKFLSDLKKYESSYEELPSFLKCFLLSEKVYVKGNKKIVDAFLSQYEESEVEQKIENVKIERDRDLEGQEIKAESKEFSTLKALNDMSLKKTKLEEFIQKTKSGDLKIEALIILLSTCVRLNDGSELYKHLKEISNYLENEKIKTILRNNLDNYLEKVVFDDCDEYCGMLEKFRTVNQVVCDRRILEVEFFLKNKTVESDFIDFQLLGAVNKGDVEGALNILNLFRDLLTRNSTLNQQIYNEIFTGTSNEITVYEDQILEKILEKCADFFFEHKKYLESLVCYAYRTNSHSHLRMYLLCVILNGKLKETNLFQGFLLKFREFSNNPLVLPSFNREIEVFRAFYCLETFDLDECHAILNRMCTSWNDKDILVEATGFLLK